MSKVAVLIVSWNSVRLGHAEDLVRSLRAVDYPDADWTILVGDNGSDDGAVDWFRRELPRGEAIAFGENLGFAEANNRLVARAIELGYDYGYLLNHDCVVDPGFLRAAVRTLEADPTIGAAQSRIHLHREPEKLNTIGNAIHFLGFGFSLGSHEPARDYPRDVWEGRDIAYCSGAGMLFRLDLAQRIGMFDVDYFMYHEDLDLGWQIRLLGFRNVCAHDSVVFHKYEFGKNTSKYYYLERNRFRALVENYRLATLLLILPGLLAFEVGMLPFAWRAGFLREKLRVYGYFLGWSNWRRVLASRARKQRRRTTSDRAMLRVMTGSIGGPQLDSWVLRRIANPVFTLALAILRRVVFW